MSEMRGLSSAFELSPQHATFVGDGDLDSVVFGDSVTAELHHRAVLEARRCTLHFASPS